jgi:hypothetical protein
MFEHRDLSGYKYQTYQIDAEDFDLQEGDIVQPGLEIGTDIYSQTMIYADFWGYVATAYYNTMNDSFLVMVCRQVGSMPQFNNSIRVMSYF